MHGAKPKGTMSPFAATRSPIGTWCTQSFSARPSGVYTQFPEWTARVYAAGSETSHDLGAAAPGVCRAGRMGPDAGAAPAGADMARADAASRPPRAAMAAAGPASARS